MGMLDTLTSLAAPAAGQIASRLGESDAAVSRGIPSALASVLGGVSARAQDPNLGTKVFDFISNVPATADMSTSGIALSDSLTGASTSGIATSFLNLLFGSRTNSVGDLLTRSAGFGNPSSGSALLSLAAPLVLSFLGKKVRDEKLDAAGFANAFASERDSILAAAPPGLMDTINAPVREARPTEERRYAGTIPEHRNGSSRRWLWPVVAVAALAFVWFLTAKRLHVRHTVQTSAGSIDVTTPDLGPFAQRTLPGGVRLNIPDNGTEARMLAFIEDASLPVNDSVAFDFDRVNFAPGSPTILPNSKEQIDNIAAVLKAYPAVMVKVVGYTDNVGDPARNMKLSQERAEAVKSAIVADGIDSNRLQTEGYGETHPVATNATPQGRAQNRRIALIVTAK